MNLKVLSLALMLLAIAVIPASPAFAWTYPDQNTHPETQDTKYEMFGPRLDRLRILLYPNEDLEWDALERGEIDMTDWPLDFDRQAKLTTPPENEYINTKSYGAELGYFLVDVNNDNSKEKAPGYPNPVYKKNPFGFEQTGTEPYKQTAAIIRHALMHTLDRSYLVSTIWKGLAVPMYGPVPSAMGIFEHPNSSVNIPEHLEAGIPSTYPQTTDAPGLNHDFNLTRAAAILDSVGLVDTDGDGWRNFPVALGGDGANIVLDYYMREDHEERTLMGLAHAGWLESIGLQVNELVKDRVTDFYQVMVYKNFHLYTGGWLLGRDPDHLVLYSSEYYWHPGFCYNYGRVNDTEFDRKVNELLEANTWDEALEKTYEAQVRWAYHTNGVLFAVSTSAAKAWYRTYTGGTAGVSVTPDDGENQYRGRNWLGLTSVESYGIDSFYTFLNAHPESYEMGDGEKMTMRWGFKTSSMEKPSNPAYAEWVWDWNVLGLSYESLLARDPYTFEWMPWLVKSKESFTWFDPDPVGGGIKSGVRFSLRHDVYWSDGVPMTAADIFYTLLELPHELIDLGYGPPWWWSNVVYIKSMYMTDPSTIEILLDIKSVFAEGWIGGSIVLPKHIWKPMVEADKAIDPDPYDFWGAYVDPDVIATGPYRFVDYEEKVDTLLVPNSPGSTVQTTWPGSKPVTSPGFFRYHPKEVNVQIDDPPEYAGKEKFPPGLAPTYVNFTITDHYHDKTQIIVHNNVTLPPDWRSQPISTTWAWQWPDWPIPYKPMDESGRFPNLHLTYWEDQNPDGEIGFSDVVGMTIDLPHDQAGLTVFFHVEDIWWDDLLQVYKMRLGRVLWTEKNIYFSNMTRVNVHNLTAVDLFNPVSTIWEEHSPGTGPIRHIDTWNDINNDGRLSRDDIITTNTTETFEIENVFGATLLAMQRIYLLPGFPKFYWEKASVDHVEKINLRDLPPPYNQMPYWPKGKYDIKVKKHVLGPEYLMHTDGNAAPNPWVSTSAWYRFEFWVTIKEDIGGSTYYDDIMFNVTDVDCRVSDYPYKKQLPSPDMKVDILDVATAAKAFGSFPGHPRWNPIGDINGDYKVDIKDIAAIAKKFGWA